MLRPGARKHRLIRGLHCLLKEALNTTECMDGEQRSGCFRTDAQSDLKLRILQIFEDNFRSTRPM